MNDNPSVNKATQFKLLSLLKILILRGNMVIYVYKKSTKFSSSTKLQHNLFVSSLYEFNGKNKHDFFVTKYVIWELTHKPTNSVLSTKKNIFVYKPNI